MKYQTLSPQTARSLSNSLYTFRCSALGRMYLVIGKIGSDD